jgi:hypothetical protein
MKRAVACLLALLFASEAPLWAGLGSEKAMFVGGTVTSVSEKTQGDLTLGEGGLLFRHKQTQLQIPYNAINSLEYGQKAGRRLGLGIAISPLFLLSKKRRHFLTVGYLDDGKHQQAAVFELGKSLIQPILNGLEQKTGKKIEYEDDEARKSASSK